MIGLIIGWRKNQKNSFPSSAEEGKKIAIPVYVVQQHKNDISFSFILKGLIYKDHKQW